MFVALAQEIPAWTYGYAMHRVLSSHENDPQCAVRQIAVLESLANAVCREYAVVQRPLYRAIAISTVIRLVISSRITKRPCESHVLNLG